MPVELHRNPVELANNVCLSKSPVIWVGSKINLWPSRKWCINRGKGRIPQCTGDRRYRTSDGLRLVSGHPGAMVWGLKREIVQKAHCCIGFPVALLIAVMHGKTGNSRFLRYVRNPLTVKPVLFRAFRISPYRAR